jgi:hypothetical protein
VTATAVIALAFGVPAGSPGRPAAGPGGALDEHRALAAPPGQGVFRPSGGANVLAQELRTIAR